MSIHVDAEKFKDYIASIFLADGLQESYAREIADNLVQADMRGVRSHGTVQVKNYVTKYDAGEFNKTPNIQEVKEAPATLLIDGDLGPGAVVGKYAMQRTIEKAKTTGVAVTTVKNGTHFGMAAYYAMDALAENMIGLAFTNAGTIVAPFGGYLRELGTNPICIAAPTGRHLPFVFDAATSRAAFNKIFFAHTEGRTIPDDWAMDPTGKATTNPADIVIDGGALYPFGGYKGYGLAVAVNILTGILSGAETVRSADGTLSEAVHGIGFNFAAIDISKFIEIEEFKEMMDIFIERLKNSARVEADTPILIPGEPEFAKATLAEKEGIEIFDGVAGELRELEERFGLTVKLGDIKMQA